MDETRQVRLKVDRLIGNAHHAAGEVVEVDAYRAERMAENGDGDIIGRDPRQPVPGDPEPVAAAVEPAGDDDDDDDESEGLNSGRVHELLAAVAAAADQAADVPAAPAAEPEKPKAKAGPQRLGGAK